MTCNDAISRQAVLDILDRESHKWGNDCRDWKEAITEIKDLPSAEKTETVTEFADRCRECGERYGKYRKEAKRWKNKWLKSQKTGHWIVDRRFLPFTYTCNICGRNVFDDYDYCPNCGAKMESEEISDHNLKMWEDIFKAERSKE